MGGDAGYCHNSLQNKDWSQYFIGIFEGSVCSQYSIEKGPVFYKIMTQGRAGWGREAGVVIQS